MKVKIHLHLLHVAGVLGKTEINSGNLVYIGLHSAEDRNILHKEGLVPTNGKIVKMIIPKGATYYYHAGLYVSDRLIYV